MTVCWWIGLICICCCIVYSDICFITVTRMKMSGISAAILQLQPSLIRWITDVFGLLYRMNDRPCMTDWSQRWRCWQQRAFISHWQNGLWPGLRWKRLRSSLWWTIMFSGIRSRKIRRMATDGMIRIRTTRTIRMMRTMIRTIRTMTDRRNRKSRNVRSRRNSGRRSVRKCARIWRPVLKTRLRWLETFMTILK